MPTSSNSKGSTMVVSLSTTAVGGDSLRFFFFGDILDNEEEDDMLTVPPLCVFMDDRDIVNETSSSEQLDMRYHRTRCRESTTKELERKGMYSQLNTSYSMDEDKRCLGSTTTTRRCTLYK